MESRQGMNEQVEQSEGRRWLEMLGLLEHADVRTNYNGPDGQPLVLGDFHEICGDHVRPLFEGLSSTKDPHDPKAERVKQFLREQALGYIANVKKV